MAGEKKIAREDIMIKARMLSEGVRINIPELSHYMDKLNTLADEKSADFDVNDGDSIFNAFMASELLEATNHAMGDDIILDGSRIPAPILPNPYSRLSVAMDEGKVVITDQGEVLTTGRFKPMGKKWGDLPLSNGKPALAALPGASSTIINMMLSYSCNNMNTNRGCRYCNLFGCAVSKKINHLPLSSLSTLAKYQAEAVKIATEHGWRGTLAITGGALPRSERPKYMERLEIVIDALRKELGDKTLSQQHVLYNHYPPEDFSDMYKWKELGINGTGIDLEVMDPAYFPAICPGKNAYKPHSYWKEAQEASVEVFGPMIGTVSCIVMGIEPMTSLLEGIDERLSKGVFPVLLTFQVAPGSALEGFRPPTADWLVEAADKAADIYLKYAKSILTAFFKRAGAQALGRIGGPSMTSGGNASTAKETIVFDEVMRRILDMGMLEKLGLLRGGKS